MAGGGSFWTGSNRHAPVTQTVGRFGHKENIMILSQLQKDVEQVQACLAKGNLDEAETMLELVLMDIKNAQQGLQSDVLITCANCGVYHSIYTPCPSSTAQVARR